MIIKRLATRLLTRGLSRFSNLHAGESCYIFGDGPSVKWFDLGLFNDRPAICCGLLPFHRDFHKLNVKYVLLAEPWAFAPQLLQPKSLHSCARLLQEYRVFIDRSPDTEFFVNLSNRLFLNGPNINYVYRGLPKNRNRTDELLGRFDLFSGSFHASLTLAYYLGFSIIYLVGFDAWTIQPARNLHWYEVGEGILFEATNFATDFLEILKRDTDIYTISVDGHSKNVKHISYQSLTGQFPVFKENYEIMDEYYLKIMASYPGYRIFSDRP